MRIRESIEFLATVGQSTPCLTSSTRYVPNLSVPLTVHLNTRKELKSTLIRWTITNIDDTISKKLGTYTSNGLMFRQVIVYFTVYIQYGAL